MRNRLIILYFILIIPCALLISCAKKEENIRFDGDYEILNKYIDIDKDWTEKYGQYGYYYTNYDDFILINKFDNTDNLKNKIINDINFYNPKHFRLTNDYRFEIYNDEFILSKKEDKYNISKGKIIKNNGEFIYIIVGTKDSDIGILYEKTFK